MAAAAKAAGPSRPITRREQRRVLVVLCATEITSWGILYYAFPVLLGQITAATGWSAAATTAALSLGQLVAALVGIPVGRLLDRVGPRWIMTGGSLIAVPGVVGVAYAPNLSWFIAAWLIVGVAMGAVLYQPAFAALTRWHGPNRVRALTVLTLAAGLASTVFAPLTAWLSDHLDWRDTYLVLAGLLAVVTIPGHWFGLRLPWPPAEDSWPTHPAKGVDPARVARSRAFLALVVAFSIAAFATFSVVINLVPLMTERGIGLGVAALALGLGGAGQVAGRIGYGTLSARTSVRGRTALVLFAMAATTALLGIVTGTAALIAGAILAGMARGVFTLLQATAITDRWGTTQYGRLSGLLAAPLTIMTALAPFAGAALAELLGGYSTTFLLLGAVAAGVAVLSLVSAPRRITKDLRT